MRCQLIASDNLDDWYTIERLEHDGRTWMEPMPGGASFMMSARPSDACIEGTSEEMLSIAYAINRGEEAKFKRCAATVNYDGNYNLWSPRNSMQPEVVTLEEAKELADDIIAKLGKGHPQPWCDECKSAKCECDHRRDHR